MANNEARIKVVIDGKEAEISIGHLGKEIQKTMKKSSDSVKNLKDKFSDIKTVMKTAVAGFIIKDLVQASNTQEKAVAAMEQALRSMGRYTDEFSKKIQGVASQIQENGIIGDEALLEGAKFLATYKDISDETMPRAMKIMADFAALTGGDVTSAANILGKASMGMTGEMARYGITLSETAKTSKDFNLILQEIEEQVGGQNKALANTAAGSMQQFSNALGDLKEKGGDLLKIFILPLQRLITPLVNFLNNFDKATLMMIGTMGLAAATVFKVVIPAMKAFGVVSKSALGWVGLIIAAIELLYMAWDTNFLGITTFLKTFWNFIKNWFNNLGDALSAVGQMLKGAVTLDFDAVKQGWQKIKDLVVKSWTDAAEKIEKETPKTYKKIGEDAGNAFGDGLKTGLDKTDGYKIITETLAERLAARMDSALLMGQKNPVRQAEKDFWDIVRKNRGSDLKMEEQPQKEKLKEENQELIDYRDELKKTVLTAQNAIDIMRNSFNSLGTEIVDIMWGGKNDLKAVWKGIAQDFTKLFVDEVLRVIARVLVVQMLRLLAMFDVAANDRMAQRIGRDYARHFSQGVVDGLSRANLAGAMAGVGRGGGAIVNIGSERVYAAVNSARSRERIRRGTDINRENFQ